MNPLVVNVIVLAFCGGIAALGLTMVIVAIVEWLDEVL